MVKKAICKRFDLHQIKPERLETGLDGDLSEKAAHQSQVHTCRRLM